MVADGLLGTEESVRAALLRQPLSRPLVGGIQTRKVYLTRDYAIHVLRVRGASSLASGLRSSIDRNRALRTLDRWLSGFNSPLVHAAKQNAKVVIELFKGNFAVLSHAKLGRTLRSHRLSDAITDLTEPYLYLERVAVSRRLIGFWTVRTHLSHVIVKPRNDRFIADVLREQSKTGQIAKLKQLIDEALEVDEAIWSRARFNTDLVFLGNLAFREDKLLLRDIGALTDQYSQACQFIVQEAGSHISETAKRLGKLVPYEVVEHYLRKAEVTYTLENLDRRWPSGLR